MIDRRTLLILLGARPLLGVSLACAFTASGCESWPRSPRGCPDIELGSMPSPPGSFNDQWIEKQARKADADRLVIHLCEWKMGGATLGPDGERHLDRLVAYLPEISAECPSPILIADSDDKQLNDERRQVIVQELADRGVPDAAGLVSVGMPAAEGLYGQEAMRAGNIRQIGAGTGIGGGQGGMGGGAGGLGGGGLGGGGLGGGGLGGGGGGFGGGGFF